MSLLNLHSLKRVHAGEASACCLEHEEVFANVNKAGEHIEEHHKLDHEYVLDLLDKSVFANPTRNDLIRWKELLMEAFRERIAYGRELEAYR